MSSTRDQFREFLLRLADDKLLPDDWDNFAVQHSEDEELEQLRRCLVRQSLDISDQQVGRISKNLQEFARILAESLQQLELESVTYWTEWSGMSDEDGAIHIKATWFESGSHSTGVCEIPRDHPDYRFWWWLCSHDIHRNGLKRKAEIDALKAKFAREHAQ